MESESKDSNWLWLEGGLSHPAVIKLLSEHQERMAENSPPESRHVLNLQALQQPEITFWSLWDKDHLLGCVALKHWDDCMGEIKSMKTAPAFTRQGVGKRLLEHVMAVAAQMGYEVLKLETGSMRYFEAARQLYSSYGFEYCGPFGDYVEDPNNVFMRLKIS
jgi:putative acetyltransferase